MIVTWSVTGGGSVVKAVDTTTAGGISSARRVLGSLAGTPTTVATVTGLIGSPVSISTTATAGTATQVSLNGGNNQTGEVSLALPSPQTVLVADAYGNPRSGFTVNWVVGSGGGSVSAPSSVSGSNGIAAITRTLGPSAGTQTDTAIASGLTGSPIAFTANAVTAPVTASVTVGPGVSYSPDSVKIASG